MKILQTDKFTENKWNLVGILGKLLIDTLFYTTKIEEIGFENVKEIMASKRFIAAIWHSRILLFSYLYKGWDAAILVSQSEDGEIIARILQQQGYETIRGSTTRGGLRALAALVKALNERYRTGVIIPDGPQGPRFEVQPGVITLAKKTGYPIIPMTYGAKNFKAFASWDRFILPYPFTRCRLIYGNPLYVPHNADKDMEAFYRIRLGKELCKITDDADNYSKATPYS